MLYVVRARHALAGLPDYIASSFEGLYLSSPLPFSPRASLRWLGHALADSFLAIKAVDDGGFQTWAFSFSRRRGRLQW